MGTNWIFLGDSLTEGVGSRRVSHVTELAGELRASGHANANVHEFRLRHVDTQSFNRFIDFNVAGLMNVDGQHSPSDLWLWNLACEGQTIESDLAWLPLIATLRPELVVIFRGSLESIIRPATVSEGGWPWWLPNSWRGYAAMDPRCYFSTTSWRKAKQTSIDALKQKARLKLLRARPGRPLMDLETFASHQAELIKRLRALGTRVLVLGLLPVEEKRFPGSREHFKRVNARLQQIAQAEQIEFFDWASQLEGGALFYRDGFHPNAAGALALAKILRERLAIHRLHRVHLETWRFRNRHSVRASRADVSHVANTSELHAGAR
jgi:lysophospholipase L1-like esterase